MRFVFLNPSILIRQSPGNGSKAWPAFDPGDVAELNLICSTGRAAIIVTLPPELETAFESVLRHFSQEGVSCWVVGMLRAHDTIEETLALLGDLVDTFVILDSQARWDYSVINQQWIPVDPANGLTRANARCAIKQLDDQEVRSQTELKGQRLRAMRLLRDRLT